MTKNWGAGAGFNKGCRQQDEENSGWLKYTKMLESKLKTNQIQVITGDNCLQFSVIFNVYFCAFPSTFHKKLSTNINLTLLMRTKLLCFLS